MAVVIDEDEFEHHFTQVPNARLRSPALSWKAKGMADYLASHRAGYRITVEQIVAEGKGGPSEVRSTLRELQRVGLLRRVQARDSRTGRYGEGDLIFRNTGRIAALPEAENPQAVPSSGSAEDPHLRAV